ncbi:hypothetical protein V6N13_007614 [Hibiscus sabdariffa]|uniref:RNase H type-1 domain-containing protein n=1 Tax=Hibiscus sabdariffa TaxID=183260 RepID=A0ABR2EN47_9ROSI
MANLVFNHKVLGNFVGPPSEPLEFFLAWHHLCSKLGSDHIWSLMPFAIVWSILLHINDIVFQGKTADVGQLLFIAKMKVSWWCKAKVHGSLTSIDSIISDPSNACQYDGLISKTDAYFAWSPPPLGFLKFNVDGDYDKTCKCGFEGVLRNHKGAILSEFS